MLGILSKYGCILCGHVVDLMAVGDTDYSPPTTAVKFVSGNSSHHIRGWENPCKYLLNGMLDFYYN